MNEKELLELAREIDGKAGTNSEHLLNLMFHGTDWVLEPADLLVARSINNALEEVNDWETPGTVEDFFNSLISEIGKYETTVNQAVRTLIQVRDDYKTRKIYKRVPDPLIAP